MGTIVTETESSSKTTIRGGGKDFTTVTVDTTDTGTYTDSIKLKGKSTDSVTFTDQDTWFKNELISSGDEDFIDPEILNLRVMVSETLHNFMHF